MAGPALRLLRRTTCPHCWATFAPEEVLWISAHSDLLGDPRLGPEQPQRFLPTRFDVNGNALDSRGMVCQQLACPQCHLSVPRALLEMEPCFVSILGSPACGKSYFLAALTWELRRLLPQQFGLSFADVDAAANRTLSAYEESLFLNHRADEFVALASLVPKTELEGALYDTVTFGSQVVRYPRPFLFALRPNERHPGYASAHDLARVLCLYDNAGEHFQPGQDSPGNPVTQHLAQSRVLLFLFDPTQDQRFRTLCRPLLVRQPSLANGPTSRQESVLLEAAARVRRYAGLPEGAQHDRPLVVILTKFDGWSSLLGEVDTQEPWLPLGELQGLDTDRIGERSRQLKDFLGRVCPEVVAAAEGFSRQVLFLAVSSLGTSPALTPETKRLAIRPRDIHPSWVTAPLLYGLSRSLPGLVTSLRRKAPAAATVRPARPGAATRPVR